MAGLPVTVPSVITLWPEPEGQLIEQAAGGESQEIDATAAVDGHDDPIAGL